jgi:cyclopropane fatty-acyl-phospholipid synthase-like methyltransferase
MLPSGKQLVEMTEKISPRLLEIVNALPLKEGMRVLEIGCGPGVAAREIARRYTNIYVLAIDRSGKAIQQAISNSKKEIQSGKLEYRLISIEEFELQKGDALFDLAFGIRVGALDGRHPEIEEQAIHRIKKALTKKGKCFIDGGNPLKEIAAR